MTVKSNIIWTSKEAAQATEGKAQGEWTATSVSIDSRSLQAGALFVALAGDHADGHLYVADALAKGAAAAVVTHVPEGVDENAPLLIVGDTLEALEGLGQRARYRTGAKVVGVTGSVGKTTTKEMLAAVFSSLGQVHASRASYNNQWGVPLSLANMHQATDFGVFEMGMNHADEITPLTQQVKPDVAIITTVAPVHIENFESEQGIADAKAEIFEGMQSGGVAVLNRDNKWFAHLKAKAETAGIVVRGFGENVEADARLLECLEAANGSRVKANIGGEDIVYTLQMPGRHLVMNSLAVLLAVKELGEDLKKAATALERMESIQGRGKTEYLDLGEHDNPVTLIDESYNASPVAMRAAFKVMALIDPGRGGRRIAVLGDMLELGKDAPRMHAELALPLAAADVQLVYTSGPLMRNLYDALPNDQRGAHKNTSKELAKIVPDVLVPGDVVMVKGSNGSKMGTVVEALRKLPGGKGSKSGEGDDSHAV